MSELKKIIEHTIKQGFKQLSPLGSYQFFIIFIIMFYLLKLFEETLFLLWGFIIIKAIAIPIRLIFFKERPKKIKYSNVVEKVHASSFPSLHTTRTVFLVLFFINFFEKDLELSLFVSLLGFLVVIGRIYRKRHYPSDVSAGIVFGVIVYLGLRAFL